MIQRISKDNDIIINIQTDVNDLQYLELQYYTDGQVVIEPLYDNVNHCVYLPSTELKSLADGQLTSTVKYGVVNANFPDGIQDVELKQYFQIWLQN